MTTLFAACGGEDFASGDPNPTLQCGADQAACSNQCVSAADPAFGCGSCTPCALDNAVATCSGGSCAVESCQNGFADCDGTPGCEASLGSAEHCGACDKACSPGQLCDAGNCSDGCSSGKTQCGTSCVDLGSDVLHCGDCDNACGNVSNALSVCASGNCGLACNDGFLNCDGKRENGCEVNSKLDPKHCGACGAACKAGELCQGGTCELSCGGGTTECDGACVDLNTDENNCGDCGKPCAAGQNCVGGVCKLNCGGGTTECNGACVDTKFDPNNCGSCGNVCQAGYICQSSKCEPSCTVPVPVVIFNEEFANNSKGWTLDSNWQIGPATSSVGHTYGNPDPALDATPTTNDGVAGVIIGGNAPQKLHNYYFLTSPIINTAAVTNLVLGYQRWLNSDFEPYMKSVVEVFNGSTWVTIWETEESPGVTDTAWVQQSFDITAHKNANLRIRFGYKIGDSTVYSVSGWNVDDVKLTAITCN